MSPKAKTPGKKTAVTSKRSVAAKKAAATRKHRQQRHCLRPLKLLTKLQQLPSPQFRHWAASSNRSSQDTHGNGR